MVVDVWDLQNIWSKYQFLGLFNNDYNDNEGNDKYSNNNNHGKKIKLGIWVLTDPAAGHTS